MEIFRKVILTALILTWELAFFFGKANNKPRTPNKLTFLLYATAAIFIAYEIWR